MTSRRFLVLCLITVALASAVRFAWLTADPPVQGDVGIVWHDEGAWVHNARNRALWGTWQTDNWNPLYLAPVFTLLEYAAFETFGVGTWQARVVPAVSGIVAVGFLIAGLALLVGRRIAIVCGLLLAFNYAFVMWNRAALMESTMTMWMVVAWAAYALSSRRPAWALVAAGAAAAAWFTKAASAFFVAALAVDALWALVSTRRSAGQTAGGEPTVPGLTLTGLTLAFAGAGLLFVVPNWEEYAFYNWQMSVTRKPDYTLGALADRATWLPIVQSLFGRMWLELAAGSLGLLAVIRGWQQARPAERLLVLWVGLGLLELVVHDAGNQRRYVMFVPAFIAAAGVFASRWTSGSDGPARSATPTRLLGLKGLALVAAVALLAYLAVGSALRPLFLNQIDAGLLRNVVRWSALAAALAGLLAAIRLERFSQWLEQPRVPTRLAVTLVAGALAMQAWQYGSWAVRRQTINYQAAVEVGRALPDGTLVQGKLANGLSLESRIRPIFIGNGFGNFADRLQRDDVRYILTYDLPRVGYESSDGSGLIQGILEQYPRRRVVDAFEVDETPLPDRAVLIDKFPGDEATDARD